MLSGGSLSALQTLIPHHDKQRLSEIIRCQTSCGVRLHAFIHDPLTSLQSLHKSDTVPAVGVGGRPVRPVGDGQTAGVAGREVGPRGIPCPVTHRDVLLRGTAARRAALGRYGQSGGGTMVHENLERTV